jgi:hypothetical protein
MVLYLRAYRSFGEENISRTAASTEAQSGDLAFDLYIDEHS